MLTKRVGVQIRMYCTTLGDLVSQEHFLQKLEKAVDFSFTYDEIRDLCYPDSGRPGADPVVLVRYPLVRYLHEIESGRRIEQEI